MYFSLGIEWLLLTQILNKLDELEEKGPMKSVLSILPWWPFKCYYSQSFFFLLHLVTCLHCRNVALERVKQLYRKLFQKRHCPICWRFIEAKNGRVNGAINTSVVCTWCLATGEYASCPTYSFSALSEPCLASACHSSLNPFTPLPKSWQGQAANFHSYLVPTAASTQKEDFKKKPIILAPCVLMMKRCNRYLSA